MIIYLIDQIVIYCWQFRREWNSQSRELTHNSKTSESVIREMALTYKDLVTIRTSLFDESFSSSYTKYFLNYYDIKFLFTVNRK